MIQVDLVDYSGLTDLGMQITKYVNRNLKDIIRVLIDVLETDPEFELDGFFPRDYIKPKYEYLLYAILGWWEDCADSEDDLIINSVDDQLRDALDNRKVELF